MVNGSRSDGESETGARALGEGSCAVARERTGDAAYCRQRDVSYVQLGRWRRRIERAANADAIVSGDAHLLNLARYHGIPIITAAEAIKTIGG